MKGGYKSRGKGDYQGYGKGGYDKGNGKGKSCGCRTKGKSRARYATIVEKNATMLATAQRRRVMNDAVSPNYLHCSTKEKAKVASEDLKAKERGSRGNVFLVERSDALRRSAKAKARAEEDLEDSRAKARAIEETKGRTV